MAGDISLPRRWIERELERRLNDSAGEPSRRFRVVRWEGLRGLVEIEHLDLERARHAWNLSVAGPNGAPVAIRTHRTWGTLRKGKAWLARPVPSAASHPPPSRDD